MPPANPLNPINWPNAKVLARVTQILKAAEHPTPPLRQLRIAGKATWQELHTYQPLEDLALNELWFKGFNLRLCLACRPTWTKYLEENPPDWNHWLDWTTVAHNHVNARLGKPLFSLSESRALWVAVDQADSSLPPQ